MKKILITAALCVLAFSQAQAAETMKHDDMGKKSEMTMKKKPMVAQDTMGQPADKMAKKPMMDDKSATMKQQ